MPTKQPTALLSRTQHQLLLLLVVGIISLLFMMTTHAYTLLGEREIRMSSSEPNAINNYQVGFDVSTSGDLGGIVITFCADSPIINDTDCVAPNNFNLTNGLASLNIGDIDLGVYEATVSQHTSSGSANNTVTLTPSNQPDVENWAPITNTNVSPDFWVWAPVFTADNDTLVLAHSDGDYVTFVDSSNSNPANWTEISNSNISLPGTVNDATFSANESVLVLVHFGFSNEGVTFIDASDANPANWNEISNSNINLNGNGRTATFSNDYNTLVLGHTGADYLTLVDSSSSNAANWTEITNNNINIPNRVNDTTFSPDGTVLVIARNGFPRYTFIDSSDPDPANWTEIENFDLTLPFGEAFGATFNSAGDVLIMTLLGGDNVVFIDSSDPDPGEWEIIANSNISLAGEGWKATFNNSESVLVLVHDQGNGITFVDSSDPDPGEWDVISNSNINFDAGLSVTFTADNNTLVVGHAGGNHVTFIDASATLGFEPSASATSGESAAFELVNARNPSTLGTFYARIYTYADPAHALGYTLANPSAGGPVIDAGGIALSTAELLTIESKVQERLTFCLFTDNLSSAADYETCAKPAPDPVLLGDSNGVLSPNQPSIANNTHYNITTNASAGATIRAKMSTLTAGSFIIDPIGDVTPGDGESQGSSPGTEQFGFCTFTQSSSVTTDLTPLSPYNHPDCENTIAGQAANNDQGAQFAFNEATLSAPPANPYGDAIASKPAGDWSTGTIALLANIATTTEPGIYTTTMELIATGRY